MHSLVWTVGENAKRARMYSPMSSLMSITPVQPCQSDKEFASTNTPVGNAEEPKRQPENSIREKRPASLMSGPMRTEYRSLIKGERPGLRNVKFSCGLEQSQDLKTCFPTPVGERVMVLQNFCMHNTDYSSDFELYAWSLKTVSLPQLLASTD